MSNLILPSYSQGFARNAAESAYPNLWKDLVGLWAPSLGPTGLTLFDHSAGKNHGTLTLMNPATDWVTSPFGWALDFDGNNQGVEGILNLPGTGDFTIGVWANLRTGQGEGPSVTYDFFLAALDDQLLGSILGGNFCLLYFDNGTTLRFLTSDGTDVNYTIALDDGQWHFIVALQRSGQAFIYLDGEQVATDVTSSRSAYSRWLISTINDVGVRGWDGYIADSFVYSRALFPSEIQDLYNNPNALLQPRSRIPALPAVGLSIPIAMHHYKQLMGAA